MSSCVLARTIYLLILGRVFQTFIDQNGQRSSTAAAYLKQSLVETRPNLKIAVGVTVTKIIFDTTGTKPRAVGIELGPSGFIRYLAAASKEVIICAGAVHTPQVLSLSGIGNANDLTALDIPVIKDLPAVGQNLVDHIYVNVVANVKPTSSMQWLGTDVKALPSFIRWLINGTGPMCANFAEAAGFFRFADRRDAPALLKERDLSSGPTSSDVEILHTTATNVGHGVVSRLQGYVCHAFPISLIHFPPLPIFYLASD